MQKVLFLGGPGTITTSTAQELLKKGMQLGILKRSDQIRVFNPPGDCDAGLEGHVSIFNGDRYNEDDIDKAVSEFKPDIVIDVVCRTLQQAEMAYRAVKGRVARYIFISTVDVYGFPLSHIPMREGDPFRAPSTQYAAEKKACEDFFLQKHDMKEFPLTIVRPAYSFMPERYGMMSFFAHREAKYLVPRLRAGKPILVPGDGTTLLHVSCARNTGRMLAEIVASGKTIGRAYNCGHETFLTHDGYISLLAEVLGCGPVLVHIPSDLIVSIDSEAVRNSLIPNYSRYNLAFSVEAFKADFPDFKWELSLEDEVKRYIDWGDKYGLFPKLEEDLYQDKIVKAWYESISNFKEKLV